MTRKDLYIALAILIDVLVILTYSLSNTMTFMDFLKYRTEAAYVFWAAFVYLIWVVGSAYVLAIVKVTNKKD